MKKFFESHQMVVRNINNSLFDSIVKEGSQITLLINSAMIGGILFFFHINCKDNERKWETSNSIHLLITAYYFVAPVLILYFFYKILLIV
jgi:hypothetical protein